MCIRDRDRHLDAEHAENGHVNPKCPTSCRNNFFRIAEYADEGCWRQLDKQPENCLLYTSHICQSVAAAVIVWIKRQKRRMASGIRSHDDQAWEGRTCGLLITCLLYTSKSSCPLRPGLHTCYNGVNKGKREGDLERIPKITSQFGL